MDINKIQLGDRAADKITGFTGIAVADTLWLHGCRRITLQPEKLRDGRVIDQLTFDEPQLKLIKRRVVSGVNITGGPRPEPERNRIVK